jgi:hypothetical protein
VFSTKRGCTISGGGEGEREQATRERKRGSEKLSREMSWSIRNTLLGLFEARKGSNSASIDDLGMQEIFLSSF